MTDQSTTKADILVAEQVIIVNPQPTKTKLRAFFEWAVGILPIIHGGLVAPLCRIWANYYRQVPTREGVIMPHSALSFIVYALLAFVQIKSQGVPGFPFKTHPQPIMCSVTSLMMYGLASAAELVISAASFDHTSIYAIIAHLGKVASLCIMVVSLASLFYL
ncbi:hypothetical protein Hanom_Chr04g00312021 [Helianthus anomalus]